MCGPHHCLGRGASAPNAEIIRTLLQRHQNASIIEQRCAGYSSNSANRKHQITRHSRRTSPPLRPSLSFRYTQDNAGLKRREPLLALGVQIHCRFPIGRIAGIVAVRRQHFAVEFSRQGDDLPLAQLGVGLAVNVLVPRPLKLDVFLHAADLGELGVGGAEGKPDLATSHEGNDLGRDAPPKPKIFTSRILPRSNHAHRHYGPPLCTTGRLRKTLFYRYKLNLLRFSGGLAERVGLSSPSESQLSRCSHQCNILIPLLRNVLAGLRGFWPFVVSMLYE